MSHDFCEPVAWLCGSDSESVMRLQAERCLSLWSSEGSTKAGGSVPRWITHTLASWCWLLRRGRSSFPCGPSMGLPMMSLITTSQHSDCLPSASKREQDESHHGLYAPHLRVRYHDFHNSLLITLVSPLQYERDHMRLWVPEIRINVRGWLPHCRHNDEWTSGVPHLKRLLV